MNGDKVARFVIGAAVILGFFGAFSASYVRSIDVSMKEIAMVLVGWLASKFGTVVDYYFGSSSGSARKDEIITGDK